MAYQSEVMKLTKRELFEEVKDLDEALKAWTPDEAQDEDEFWNVRALMLRDYNERYVLLFRRMFHRSKIFRVNPNW